MSTSDADVNSRKVFEWPSNRTIYFTLDYECDFGTALPENTYGAIDHTRNLVSLLERLDVPLTCFVQTELLDERPEAVERLRKSDVSVAFHPHSHTHLPRERTSIRREIKESTDRFESFFGDQPTGYRFPNGNIRPDDYRLLSEFGYEFDASVFPSWRPGHFNNTKSLTTPQYLDDYDLVELPFTVYSDSVRIPTALSYCQLLGSPYTSVLTRRPPSSLVFNIHMHDLVTPSSYYQLPRHYQALYSRNRHGLALLEKALQQFKDQGYAFGHLDHAHESIRGRVSEK